MDKFNTLCLSGGGLKGIAMLGALHFLYRNGLDNVEYYIGSSIGAMIALLLVVGYTPMELILYICMNKLFEREFFFDVFNMVNLRGALKWSDFNTMLETLLIKKIGTIPTLGMIEREFHKEIVMVTYNYTAQRVEYISSKTHGDVNCLMAVRMSCNLPLIFEPCEYMRCQYVDGCMANAFPINYYSDESIHKTVAITLFGNLENENANTSDNTLLSYVYNLMSVPIKEILKRDMAEFAGSNSTIITLQDINIFAWEFRMDKPKLYDLFSKGYQQAARMLDPQHHTT